MTSNSDAPTSGSKYRWQTCSIMPGLRQGSWRISLLVRLCVIMTNIYEIKIIRRTWDSPMGKATYSANLTALAESPNLCEHGGEPTPLGYSLTFIHALHQPCPIPHCTYNNNNIKSLFCGESLTLTHYFRVFGSVDPVLVNRQNTKMRGPSHEERREAEGAL